MTVGNGLLLAARSMFPRSSLVMPGPDPVSIKLQIRFARGWIAGSSPAMTTEHNARGVSLGHAAAGLQQLGDFGQHADRRLAGDCELAVAGFVDHRSGRRVTRCLGDGDADQDRGIGKPIQPKRDRPGLHRRRQRAARSALALRLMAVSERARGSLRRRDAIMAPCHARLSSAKRRRRPKFPWKAVTCAVESVAPWRSHL